MRSTYLVNSLMLRLAKRDFSKFGHEIPRAREVQNGILRHIVGKNTQSEFGKQHGFSEITDYKSYARRVPIRDYEAYHRYILRIDRPESRILTEEKTIIFEPTSGSSGAAKYIPYTRGLKKEFYRAINPWIVDIYRRRPGLLEGRSYWSISPPLTEARPPAESTVPVGFEADSDYLSRLSRRLMETTFVTPRSLKAERDTGAFFHRLGICLLGAEDLSLVSIWNPTAFLAVLDFIEKNRFALLEALEKEPIRRDGIFSTRSPERGKKLRELFTREPVPFSEIWRNLRFISCWADGDNRTYADLLQSLFPDAEIQGKGLIATEGIITIPFAGRSYLPAYQSHFFEFLPEGESSDCLLLHELKTGESYRVVLTTSGGFYRYSLGDIVTVPDRFNGLPLLHFISRDRVLDHFGEKLHMGYVQRATDRALAPIREKVSFTLFGFESAGNSGFYCLYLEAATAIPPPSAEELIRLRDELERSLSDNYHYAHAVTMLQLQPLRVFLIERDGAATYLRRMNERGIKLGDIKTEMVSTLTRWSHFFSGNFVP
jgi:hypothetical protein